MKTHFEKNMRKPVQSAVVDTVGVDEMLTQDENTLAHLQALISEESKDRNLLSPPDCDEWANQLNKRNLTSTNTHQL